MDKIAVLDFGGQYAHLIANRVRRMNVYSEIFDGEVRAEVLKNFKGIILSGGPASLTSPNSVKCDPKIFKLGIPILGICYGHQLTAYTLGGKVQKGKVREYGPAEVKFVRKGSIFSKVRTKEPVWMSHFDQVVKMPKGFVKIGETKDCPIAAMMNVKDKIFCTQFHPEVTHTPCGKNILENFIRVCEVKKEWDIANYVEVIIEEIKKTAGKRKVFLMISGGVDSSVAFLLLAKSLGQDRVYGLFVDTGFMRKNEKKEVSAALKKAGVKNLHVYDASKEYFSALKNTYEPEKKRQIIGDLFLDIQAKVADKLKLNPAEWMLGQGTIYPDTIETGGTKHADKIKTHHNQVERIKKLTAQGKVIEPLRQLYKDEVRMVGKILGLPKEMVWRHPFPGPGLAVRILCTKKADYPENKVNLEKQIHEFMQKKENWPGLSSAVLPIRSVGVQGDERSYKHPVVLYGKPLSWKRLNTLATRLTNRFPEINRVLFGFNMPQKGSVHIQDEPLIPSRVKILQDADKIVMEYLKNKKLYDKIWQFPTVLLPLSYSTKKSESVVLRPVCSEEAMTANFYQMSPALLKTLTKQLQKAKGVDQIFYDITNKPPATIEWE